MEPAPPRALEERPVSVMTKVQAPSLERLLADLAGAQPGPVTVVQTHISVVLLVGDRVFKLKKPVRFPYLDFTTLARREAACRAELTLNRRLAPDVYLGLAPVVLRGGGTRTTPSPARGSIRSGVLLTCGSSIGPTSRPSTVRNSGSNRDSRAPRPAASSSRR